MAEDEVVRDTADAEDLVIQSDKMSWFEAMPPLLWLDKSGIWKDPRDTILIRGWHARGEN